MPLSSLLALVERAALEKARIVLLDEKEESDERAKLNLGHTFAHALEYLAIRFDFDLLHGEAVGMGILLAALFSKEEGYLCEETLSEIRATLQKIAVGDFTILPPSFSADSIYEAMLRDKKNDQKGLRLVLPTDKDAVFLRVEEARLHAFLSQYFPSSKSPPLE